MATIDPLDPPVLRPMPMAAKQTSNFSDCAALPREVPRAYFYCSFILPHKPFEIARIYYTGRMEMILCDAIYIIINQINGDIHAGLREVKWQWTV